MSIAIVRGVAPRTLTNGTGRVRYKTIILFASLLLSFPVPRECLGNDAGPDVCEVEAFQQENFDYAAVECWNAEAHDLRGILCLVLHPLGEGGSRLADPDPWIKLAERHHCALMTISFAQAEDLTRNWCRAERGTGRALLAALDTLAERTGNARLKTAPITVAGVCAAGQFSFHLAAFAPARIHAFMTIGGGLHDLTKVGAAAHARALVIVTPDRPPYAVSNLNALYADGISLGARWEKTSEPISYYDSGRFSAEGLSFLELSLEESVHDSKSSDIGPTSDSSGFLPFSICGKKLDQVAEVSPSTVEMNKINLLSRDIPACSFEVRAKKGASLDDIFIPQRNALLSTRIRKTGAAQWTVTCDLDPSKMPIGTSRLEVPIRFRNAGEQVLGGAQVFLNCSATGEVAWNPRILNLGTIEAGVPLDLRLHLTPKAGGKVLIDSVKSTCPWIGLKCSSQNGLTLSCTGSPPKEMQGHGIAGYFEVQLSAPVYRSLRIFYYGFVEKDGMARAGWPGNQVE